MNVLQVFRSIVFWIYDFLKGAPVKRNLKDIAQMIDHPQSTISKTKKEKYLQQIFEHAVHTTSFYSKVSNPTSINDFQVINKNIIRDHFDAFKSNSFSQKDCVVVSTSGSTGAPFKILQDCKKRDRGMADNLYFSKRSGYQIGHKLIYIKIWPDQVKVNFLSKEWFQNIFPQSVFNLKDKDIQDFVDMLTRDTSKKSILSYASALEHICKYLDKTNAPAIQGNIRSIIGFAEGLNDYTRSRIKKYFGLEPISRYSNNENGILAQQDRNNKERKFVINTASYMIEVLDLEKDIAAGLGKRGRIVVTDLHNYAMPLIRYDTGDVGVMEKDEAGVPYLKSIEGRILDLIYDTKGNLIPSHVSYKLCKYGEYKQFQLIQYGVKDYRIRLNTDKKVDESKMLSEYKEYFGQDANIIIEYVTEIPLLSSGKRREVRNTYHSRI